MVFCITNRCTMGCSHCMSDCKKLGEDFDLDNLNEFANFFKVMGFRVLNISGGEPTEHPDLEEIINQLANKCHPTVITLISNGDFLMCKEKTEAVLRLMKSHPNLTIQITSIQKWYRNYDYISKNQDDIEAMLGPGRVFFETEKIRQMRPLGRALSSPEAMDAVAETHQGFTACANAYLMAQQTVKLKNFASNCLHAHKFCTPLVGPDLNVYMSESMLCPSVGNLLEHSPVEIFKRMKAFVPCGKCLQAYNNYWTKNK